MTRLRLATVYDHEDRFGCRGSTILANAGIQYETMQQQTDLQEALTKMCPMVWANINTVNTMPEYQQIKQWCPEA
jgi:hypothetical protein